MTLNYNAPAEGQKSSIDGDDSDQVNTFFWLKKSIITARKDQYFTQLANVENMPMHMGKTIRVYEYVPLLDDRNVNDQGIDAAGATIANGNLYGSSKDTGTIVSKMPLLSEEGGRVNRVGFTRLQREGSLYKLGFFTDFTNDSMIFDSDPMLKKHLSRELMSGAVQLSEALLQSDLLASAGVVMFAGAATTDDEITAEEINGAPASIVNYRTLSRLDQILTDNRSPAYTTIITGSRYTDTKVVPSCRVAYIGSEVKPILEEMQDPFGNKAFIEVQHYAAAGTVMRGEIGSLGKFRFIQVPEMQHWAGAGAEVLDEDTMYRSTTVDGTNRYDVFPILTIGDDSFTTIGFQTNGKFVNFSVMTKMPGRETATIDEPFGEKGFSSIKWYYGILVKRPERIGLIKTVAPI